MNFVLEYISHRELKEREQENSKGHILESRINLAPRPHQDSNGQSQNNTH